MFTILIIASLALGLGIAGYGLLGVKDHKNIRERRF